MLIASKYLIDGEWWCMNKKITPTNGTEDQAMEKNYQTAPIITLSSSDQEKHLQVGFI